jgi:hypothetical protein
MKKNIMVNVKTFKICQDQYQPEQEEVEGAEVLQPEA